MQVGLGVAAGASRQGTGSDIGSLPPGVKRARRSGPEPSGVPTRTSPSPGQHIPFQQIMSPIDVHLCASKSCWTGGEVTAAIPSGWCMMARAMATIHHDLQPDRQCMALQIPSGMEPRQKTNVWLAL